MFLSKLVLDPRYSFVYRLTQDTAMLHSFILYKPFGTSRKDNNVLFRLVQDCDRYVLYVQSDALPDWGCITGNGIHLEAVRNIDKIHNVFTEGAMYGFSLVANTVRYKNPRQTIENNDPDTRKRIALKTPEDRMQWLARHAAQSGFEVVKVRELQNPEGMDVHKKANRQFKVSTTYFDGVLKITNKELFAKAFREGIGRAKAYGCGLLMLRKAA